MDYRKYVTVGCRGALITGIEIIFFSLLLIEDTVALTLTDAEAEYTVSGSSMRQAPAGPDELQSPRALRSIAEDRWLAISLENRSGRSDWTVTIPDAAYTAIALYLLDGETVLWRDNGGRTATAARGLQALQLGHRFPLSVPQEKPSTLLVHLQSPLHASAAITLSPTSTAASRGILYTSLALLTLGAALALIAHNLMLALARREPSYYWYCVQATAYVVFVTFHSGLGAPLFGLVDANMRITHTAFLLYGFFAAAFTYSFLDLNMGAGGFARVVRGIMVALALIQVTGSVLTAAAFHALLLASQLVVALVLLGAAVAKPGGKGNQLRPFVLGCGLALSANVLLVFEGLFAGPSLSSLLLPLPVGALAMLFLSLALAERERTGQAEAVMPLARPVMRTARTWETTAPGCRRQLAALSQEESAGVASTAGDSHTPPREAQRSESDQAGSHLVTSRLRILVVDDVKTNRDVVAGLLAAAGHDTATAASGEAALQRIRCEYFDVIVLDIRMPGLDGLAVTKRIRAMKEGQQASVPIIGITASLLPEPTAVYRDAGMNEVIIKPFDGGTLEAAIQRVVTQGPEVKAVHAAKRRDPTGPGSVLSEHLAALGLERLTMIIQRFAEESSATIGILEGAARKGDFGECERHAHRLSGMAGALGLTELRLGADDIESAARDKDQERLTRLVPTLKAVHRSTTRALEGACSRQGSGEPVSQSAAKELSGNC